MVYEGHDNIYIETFNPLANQLLPVDRLATHRRKEMFTEKWIEYGHVILSLWINKMTVASLDLLQLVMKLMRPIYLKLNIDCNCS